MLAHLTNTTDWLAMALALWLAAYLLIRSHRSRTTWRAVVILGGLAVAFLLAYIGSDQPSFRLANAWAAALTVSVVGFYDLTYDWLSPTRQSARWLIRAGLLSLGALKVLYLLLLPADAGLAASSGLSAAGWQPTALVLADGIFLLVTVVAAAHNLWLARQAGDHPHYGILLAAAGLAVAAYLSGMLTNLWPAVFPRLIQNLLLVAALGLLGYAVARYQAFVGRRTTLPDFPVSGVTVLGLAALYGLIANRYGLTAEQVVLVTALAILTHSGHDLVREWLDRLLHQRETALRQSLRGLAQAISAEASLVENLDQALTRAAGLLNAGGAFVAQRDTDGFRVLASFRSLPVGTTVPAAEGVSEDVREAGPALAERVSWLAPVYIGLEQVAVIGLGPRPGHTAYSATDLDLVVEVADWASRMFEADRQQQANRARVQAMVAEVVASAEREPPVTLIEQLQSAPDPGFVRLVEEALRHAADYSRLGASSLADQLGLAAGPHIERGKALRARLLEAVEALRPVGPRPTGILPREWHSYAILYDAYVEDIPNREIMARLYIGEGTFNRLRRKALQAVGRALWERRSRPALALEGAAAGAGAAPR